MVANRSRKKEKLVVTVKFEDDEEHQVYEDRVHLTSFAESQNIVHQKIAIEKPKLWNCETPHLYRCTIQIYVGEELLDEQELSYGIRKITLAGTQDQRRAGETARNLYSS